MTLTEAFVKDEVFIDFGQEVHYGSDQVYISYPCRFPTVQFQLMDTNGLSRIADRLRVEDGKKPMHPIDSYKDEDCNCDGWYDIYIGLNGFAENKLDTCIEVCVVEDSHSGDYEDVYFIDLTSDEQVALYNRLDEQCRQYLGKSCEQLLEEAHQKMVDENEFDYIYPDRYDFVNGLRRYWNGEDMS